MSPRNSSPRPAPQPGIYDALMVVACAALVTGILFLTLHLSNYNWEIAPGV